MGGPLRAAAIIGCALAAAGGLVGCSDSASGPGEKATTTTSAAPSAEAVGDRLAGLDLAALGAHPVPVSDQTRGVLLLAPQGWVQLHPDPAQLEKDLASIDDPKTAASAQSLVPLVSENLLAYLAAAGPDGFALLTENPPGEGYDESVRSQRAELENDKVTVAAKEQGGACPGTLLQASIDQPSSEFERSYRASKLVCRRGGKVYVLALYGSADETETMLDTLTFTAS